MSEPDDEAADRREDTHQPQADALAPPPAARRPSRSPFMIGVLVVLLVAVVIFVIGLGLG